MALTPTGGSERIVLAPGCPVQPLGRTRHEWPRRRELFVYRNPLGEIITLRVGQHRFLDIVSLFVPRVEWLKRLWPAPYRYVGWNHKLAAIDLMEACALQGYVELPLAAEVVRLPLIGRDGGAP